MSRILVLAGTNGAGKSSVAGEALRTAGGSFYNPDLETRAILQEYPEYCEAEANSMAWRRGVELLRRAIAGKLDFNLETTLGANTITNLLIEAAEQGIDVCMWYCALSSPELHIQRVAARVAAGGHDIPEKAIRARYDASRNNLIRLLPYLQQLRVYDNSAAALPGQQPKPVLLLATEGGRLVYLDREHMQDWAKPIAAAAIGL